MPAPTRSTGGAHVFVGNDGVFSRVKMFGDRVAVRAEVLVYDLDHVIIFSSHKYILFCIIFIFRVQYSKLCENDCQISNL